MPEAPEITNYSRASFAEPAITAFEETVGSERDTILADLLGDLMHWADLNGISFDGQLEDARRYYRAEVAESGRCIPGGPASETPPEGEWEEDER